MTPEERYELLTRDLEETMGGEDLMAILKEGRDPVVYWGTAPSGKIHLGYSKPFTHLANFLAAGARVKILLADLHAFLDDNKTPWELLDDRVAYYRAVVTSTLASIGVSVEKLEFVRGTDYQLSRDYTLDSLRVAAMTSLHDAKKAGSEVVRQAAAGEGAIKLSSLIYPGLQCLDEQYLGADAELGGVDQKKIFGLSRALLPALGYKKRTHLMNKMVASLTGGKMSASDNNSKIDLLDSAKDVKKKIGKTFCELGNIENNPPLEFIEHVIFPIHSLKGIDGLHIARDEKWGGPLHYRTFAEVKSDFAESKLSPEDLKLGLTDAINAILEPVRRDFDCDEKRQLVARAYPDPAASKKKAQKNKPAGNTAIDYSRLDVRCGRVAEVQPLQGSDKLYVVSVDTGDETGPRTVLAGLVGLVAPGDIEGRNVAVVCNLPPREVEGVSSAGVILAASVGGGEGEGPLKVEVLNAPAESAPGTRVAVEGFVSEEYEAVLPEKRKRVFLKTSQEMSVNDDLVATFRGLALTTPEGPVKVNSLKGAGIR